MIQVLQAAWRPAVEIFILAVMIYYVFTFVRGTRGFSILTGFIVVLLTLTLVSSLLELKVLRFLLGTFSAFLAVAVLVIFQPELRRMLAQLGNLPLFQTSHEQRENIEVIVQTVERLSEVRIGALMAMEQSIQVQESVESGIPVDCIATPEMLESIFFPNNAIHDGGVVIKGDRIAYAACIFPLTRRQDLNKSLGTRHRAAIGLSEETDAVVVVISEENGQVSYAYRGQLIRGVSSEELRSFLTSVLVRPAKSRRLAVWLRKWAQWRFQSARAAPSTPELAPSAKFAPAAKLEVEALAKAQELESAGLATSQELGKSPTELNDLSRSIIQ
jgi:diadenylate cyclase